MRKRRGQNKPNVKGRNPTRRFAKLEHLVLHSKAYRALSPNARALLTELSSMFNGENNGSLFLSVRDAADRIGLTDTTAVTKAFGELQEMGMIVVMGEASFHVKSSDKSRARPWRLTFFPGPGNKVPTMDFLDREPEPGTKARRRMEAGLKAIKRYRKDWDRDKFPVWDSATHDPLGRFAPEEPVVESNTAKT